MGMRSLIRGIAKNRLEAMDVRHVNKSMNKGSPITHTKNRRWMQTEQSRANYSVWRKEHIPLWKRVTTGDLARKATYEFNKKCRIRADKIFA